MQKSTITSIIISLVLIGGTFYAISGGEVAQSQNIEIRDGVQYVTVFAKDGYTPRVSQIQGGIPTKLIVKTDNTFDCSASLVVRSVGFEKILSSTGEEVIDLGVPKSGGKILGVCSMGMFNFQIKAS